MFSYTYLILLYLVPFIIIAASWNRISYVVLSALVLAGLGWMWIRLLGVPVEDREYVYAAGLVLLGAMSAGAGAGFVARGITLAAGWRSFGAASIVTILLAPLVPPALVYGYFAYDRWQRRPATADCVARPAFDVTIGRHTVSIPNWPVASVIVGHDYYFLSMPDSLRRMCAWAEPGSRVKADSASFSFDRLTHRPQPDAWVENICREGTSPAAAIVCGARPIQAIALHADRIFDGESAPYGRVSSHSAFARRQNEGAYRAAEAQRHETASSYPDGTWAFDDGSIFSCGPPGAANPHCNGDFELAPGLLARVEFRARDGKIEAAQRNARQMVERLYREALAVK